MTASTTTAIVLAGGIGSRFHSDTPKVVHPLLGRPMVGWVVAACRAAGIEDVVVVASPQTADAIAACLPEVRMAIQPEPLGTGDAAHWGMQAVEHGGRILIAAGDTPCLSAGTIQQILTATEQECAVLTCELNDPTGYGRIVREDDAVADIIEQKDADANTLAIAEINTGLFVFPATTLRQHLPELSTDNAQGERYLVDVVRAARSAGTATRPVRLSDPDDMQGINDRVQLETACTILRRRINQAWQRHGVTLRHPADIDIEPGVELAADVCIDGPAQLRGKTRIGAGTQIAMGACLNDAQIGPDCTIKPHVVIEAAALADGVTVGPFAHLRSGTVLDNGAKIGNFVETKNSRFGAGSKANHLSYVGDAEVGRDCNIGAGTITCNYDGANKHQTTLEDDVFIGSDTQLVAPVRVGKGATVGAGTTVTRDVAPGALAVSRPEQREIPNYKRKRKAKPT